MTSGSQTSLQTLIPPNPNNPSIQDERAWCDQCRDVSQNGWRLCDNKLPVCGRCLEDGLPCTNDSDPRRGIRPVCNPCQTKGNLRKRGKFCDKKYDTCSNCKELGEKCEYDPNTKGYKPRR
jgi:hypothetical protein